MDFVNGQHIQGTPNDDLIASSAPFMQTANGAPLSAQKEVRIGAAMDNLKTRSKTLIAMAEQAGYLLADRPLSITGKTAKPFKKDQTLDYLRTLNSRLSVLEDGQWTENVLQDILTTFVTDHEIGFGKTRTARARRLNSGFALARFIAGFSLAWQGRNRGAVLKMS